MTSPSHLIAGRWVAGTGQPFHSTNPATGETVWQGRAATKEEIDAALSAARGALEEWSNSAVSDRIALLERFALELKEHRDELAEVISRETGKPKWESLAEVDAMVGKVPISVQAYNDRRHPTQTESAGVTTATRYKPMGVLAVIGPFNMPGHLPNGHIVPALLGGNRVVFKPSELTPAVGQRMTELLQSAGFPPGVISMLQGGRETGAALVRHREIDGVLFTGSVAGGVAISKTLVDQPGKIVALEMGGNNPLVVWGAKDIEAAAYLTIQSAFITAGQRCSCARRLIVPDNREGQAIVERLSAMMREIVVGPSTQRPEPFIGPVISDEFADRLLKAQSNLLARGGKILVEMKQAGGRRAMLSPGLIDVTRGKDRPDEELFGPLLQVIRVNDFAAAISEANNTAYGLAAGLFSDKPDLWNQFYRKIRAGVVYWNRQTTGGSSALPFGGVGLSGNHRPSGYWAADYCSYPVASMENAKLAMPAQRTPGVG